MISENPYQLARDIHGIGFRTAGQITAIIEKVLEARGGYWASIITWSAFARRGDGDHSDWIEMALVARRWLRSDR